MVIGVARHQAPLARARGPEGEKKSGGRKREKKRRKGEKRGKRERERGEGYDTYHLTWP